MNTFYATDSDNQYPKFLFFDYEKYAQEVLKKDLPVMDNPSNDYSNQMVYSYLTEGDLPYKDVYLTKALNNIKPQNIEGLSVALALSAPSKIGISEEIASGKPAYTLPAEISQIVQNTYNRIIYREQAVCILAKILQCTTEEADIYRKELNKNKNQVLNLIMDKCISLNFEDMEQFIKDNFINYSDYFVQATALEYAHLIYNLAKEEYNC